MEKVPNREPLRVAEEAHAYIQIFQGDTSPLPKYIYDRGMADSEDALRIYNLCAEKNLGISHFFADRSPEKEQELINILERYLAKKDSNDQEQAELTQEFGELIKSAVS